MFGYPKYGVAEDGIGASGAVGNRSVDIDTIGAILDSPCPRERTVLIFVGTLNPIAGIVVIIRVINRSNRYVECATIG